MTTDVPIAHPELWSADVVVADGGVLHLRALTPDDGAALLDFVDGLSDESRYFRFMSRWRPRNEADLARFLDLDYHDRVAIVAELGDRIVAVGRYMYVDERDSAEVAFTVADDHQLRGIGTLLLEHLAVIARTNGITRFHAEALGANHKMLRVFSNAGYRVHRSLDQGVWEVDFSIDETPTDVVAAREHAAEAASVRRILAPSTIAVVGASNREGSVGHALFQNLLRAGFSGVLYPVNRSAEAVSGVLAYPSLRDVPGGIDLAVIAVPSSEVETVIAEAGEVGAGAAVIVTAGFAEVGADGAATQDRVVDLAHRHGLRVVGPNCIGVVNTDPAVGLNATFAPVAPRQGTIGFASQSGALGIAILATAERFGLGVSSFVSLGNKADVSGNDLLQYWLDDDATTVGMLYLESLGNPRKFSRLARRFSRRKPLVVVKGGRSGAAKRAAASHTAALASDDALADTLFSQAGIIRVATLEELFDVGRVLVHQPLPAGRRVAIVGNSGGPGILAADACVGAGLDVPELSVATQEKLRAVLPATAGVSNPVDVIADATPAQFERALATVMADPDIDAVLTIFTDPMVTDPTDVAAAIARAVAAGPPKPVAATFLGGDESRLLHVDGGDGPRHVPVFSFPEAAAVALGRIADYVAWRDRPTGEIPELDDLDLGDARLCVAEVLAHAPEGRWLTNPELDRLLGAVGIETVASHVVDSPEAAQAAAESIGGPVVCKLQSGRIRHKSDVGGVVLDVEPGDVAAVYRTMADRFGDDMAGALVQPMIGPGTEVIVGVLNDPSFGPAVVFGLGGIATELLADRGLRLVPLTDVDAESLLDEPRSAPLLQGYRGAEPVDHDALRDLLLRVSRLADAIGELAELDLNPVIARADGLFIVDGRARVAPVPDPALASRRRLDKRPAAT